MDVQQQPIAAAGAQPISRDDLPPSLRPWVPWVLEQLPTLGCATVQGQAVCLWPGQLQLELGAAGGSFQLDLQADRAADVRLPGNADTWPQDVRSSPPCRPTAPPPGSSARLRPASSRLPTSLTRSRRRFAPEAFDELQRLWDAARATAAPALRLAPPAPGP